MCIYVIREADNIYKYATCMSITAPSSCYYRRLSVEIYRNTEYVCISFSLSLSLPPLLSPSLSLSVAVAVTRARSLSLSRSVSVSLALSRALSLHICVRIPDGTTTPDSPSDGTTTPSERSWWVEKTKTPSRGSVTPSGGTAGISFRREL